jgi:iron complex outermembrane receptor protein
MFTLFRRWFGPLGPPLALMLILCIGGPAMRLSGAEPERRSFALAAGEAEKTLEMFSDQADVQIVFLVGDVRGVTTQPVQGAFAIRDALDRLIAHTGLRVEMDGKTGAYVVRRAFTMRAATEAPQPKNQTLPQSMEKSSRTFLAAFAGWLAASTAVNAQSPAPAGEVVKLNAFEVSSSAPNRYQASEVSSGGRIRTAIFDSPQTINVVTEALIKDVGAVRILDALKYIPGVTEGTLPASLDRLTVRGFQIDGATVDGYYDISQSNADPVTIDRIEIVKGPNAILSPTGSPGGTVNQVTKKPLFVTPRTTLQFETGLFDAGSGSLDSTGRLGAVDSKFAYRLVATYRNYDDFYGALIKRHTIAPSFAYQINPGTKLTLQAEFANFWSTPAYSGYVIDPSSGSNNDGKLLAGVDYKAMPYATDTYRRTQTSSFRLFFTSELTEHLSVRVAARQGYYFFDNIGLNFSPTNGDGGAINPLTGQFTPGIVYGPAPTFTPSPAVAQSRVFNRGGQRNVVSDKKQNFQNDWIYARKIEGFTSTTGVGFAYTRRLPDKGQGVLNTPVTAPTLNFDTINPQPLTIASVASARENNNELTRQYYGNQSLSAFESRLILSGGVSKLVVRNSTIRLLPGATNNVFINNEKNTVNYGVVVKPTNDISLFYGHSENASPVSTSLTPPNTPDFSVGNQNEFGARTRLMENRLQLGVTYYKIEQNAFSIPNPANLTVPPPATPAPLLYSDRVAKGWELEGTYEIVKGFTIIGNYTKFTNRSPYNVPFRGTAEKAAAAWARYEFQDGILKGFSASAGTNWLDRRPGTAPFGLTAASTPTTLIPNQPTFWLPARTLVDLAAGYTRGAWSYQANIDNVFDKKYILAAISRNSVWPGPGTNLRASVTYRF